MTSPEFIYTKKCINSLYGDIQVVALVGTSWLYFMHMMALKNRTSGSVGEYYSILKNLPGAQFHRHPELLEDYLPWNPQVQQICK